MINNSHSRGQASGGIGDHYRHSMVSNNFSACNNRGASKQDSLLIPPNPTIHRQYLRTDPPSSVKSYNTAIYNWTQRLMDEKSK